MEDYLAEVVMPEEISDEEPDSPSEEEIIPEAVPPTPSPVVPSEEEQTVVEYEEEIIPEPKPKPKLKQEEIFGAPKVLPVTDPSQVVPSEAVTPAKKTRKKRGPPSEEQLERLRKGREKALANRRAKAAEKKKLKEEEEQDKFLVQAVRNKQRAKLKKQLEEPDEGTPPPKVVEKPVIVEKGYSQEQLDAAVARAVEQSVEKVEKQRKIRKAKKAAAMSQKQHDEKIFHNIAVAAKNDVWADCFR
tara:strand:- start:1556 stop:2290 length:735 start_codon:yes stop_codon:yes gene_type:complete